MSANNDKKIRPFGTGWKEQGKKQAGAYGNSALQRNESNRSLEWENVFYDATGGRRNSNRSVRNSSTSNGNKSRSQHDAANRTFGHEQEYYDAPIKFSHPSNRSFCANEAPYFHPTGNGYNKVQRARVTSNTSTNSGTCRDELSGSLGGGRTTKSSRINSATSNGNLMLHGYSGYQHEYSKASGERIHSTYVHPNGGNRTKSDSSSYPAPDVNYIKNFVSQNAVNSFGSYQKQETGNESVGEHRGRDNQRKSRNASARSAVGAGNKTFNGYELQLDKSFLEMDSMMCDEVFDDNTTLDTTSGQKKLSNRLDHQESRSRSRCDRSRSNKSFPALDGSHNKDYILVTHRPARKSDDLHCARPPLPRGDDKVDTNQSFSAIRYGSSQGNVTIRGGTRNGDFIPLKHRPAGLVSQENDSYRSRSNPRFGNKPFYKHENNHAKGVDTTLQMIYRGHGAEHKCLVTNDKSAAKSTGAGTPKCVTSYFEKEIGGHNLAESQEETPRNGERDNLNETPNSTQNGSCQGIHTATKGDTRKGDIIPLKLRKAGVIPEKNEGRQSQLKPRFGHKSFDEHKNYHAKGLDTASCVQITDSKLNNSVVCVTGEPNDTACSVMKQSYSVIMQGETVKAQMSENRERLGSENPDQMINDINAGKATGARTVKCAHLEKWIGGHIQYESQDDTGFYQQAALKHNQSFAGFDSSYSDYIGAKKDEQPSNYVAAVSDDGWEVGALSDVVTERAVVVSKAESTNGCVMEVSKDCTMEGQWIHCMKLKEFSCDILPNDENVGIYTCIAGGVMSMPYVVVVENYAMFYRTDDEEAQKMPPHFEFQLIPLVEPLDNRVVPGVYRYINSDHEIYPQVVELIDMGSAYSSRDLVDYEADCLNMASTSAASDPTNNE
ncbi:hypothetical protein CRE_07648 [Caenorhabditis remanei]|uniref:Uncharacterized protein n=1 Tax=Caenorhabditis remanei TaxID=31234 RepID=E3MP34_CAERE|nr:hypothetical protein CRE_07648 [Caenorhabditis remanei]